MKKRVGITLLTAALLAVAVFGVFLTVSIARKNSAFQKTVTVGPDGAASEVLEIDGQSLYPGASREYRVGLTGNTAGTYTIRLTFGQTEAGVLADWIFVNVSLGGDSADYSLAELLDGRAIEYVCRLRADEPTGLTIGYTLDKNAGNETQNAAIDFKIVLSVRNASV